MDYEQQCEIISKCGMEMAKYAQNMLDNGPNHADSKWMIWNAYIACGIIGNDTIITNEWIIDAIANELDNMYDESIDGVQKVVDSIKIKLQWVDAIANVHKTA
jgi:hypothetical protein